ncbi:hypothetical protein B0T26DRAFT_869597 [Lasiosphaeria miniovina]|uniref:NB-ARC domain-containing protein n=1 Tax=Lasiosphaeria miniovina TaxID=1954250 RepID=A0AA40B6F8_9PEZI|nr:uncharacterized protein B0T26DRAFT_869597 [Lasiosphaeria miniovina]KAK0728575.1 hypothetical protein B0T26DRAFT_869597 [Lasiosphaeria miniovina]
MTTPLPSGLAPRTGLRQIAPVGDAPDDTTIDIIAIHGLGTESPRTWEFKTKGGGRVVKWLSDRDMLPAALPKARIFTYDWNANYFANASVQTLLGHADALLGLIAEGRGSQTRPIIFVASCFGGLILAEAMNRAAQEGSVYRQILLSTVGAVFLATPFRGSDAAELAQWQVVVGGIMGKQTSKRLIAALNKSDRELQKLTQSFAELARSDLLVTELSACLDTFPRKGLDATHSGMNKFQGPECPSFKLVKDAVKQFAGNASALLICRTNYKPAISLLGGLLRPESCQHGEAAVERHWIVPFGRNKEFVGRETILTDLLARILPSRNEHDCQRTAIEGLGGIGKTQIALEAAFRIGDAHPDCSVFWVPAVDATTFENAYRAIGQQLKVPRIDEEKADVKALVKAALSHQSAGNWLLIIDNTDDTELLFGNTALTDYLPFSRKGSILFTTRDHELGVRLVESESHIISVEEMSKDEALKLLQKNLKSDQMSDIRSNEALLEFLANLPLAIQQTSAYMAKKQISTAQYLELCESSDEDMIELLSRDFEDRHRYKSIQNPVATTWLISFRNISDHDPLAANYLKFMCFLAGKDIPRSLLPPAGRLEAVDAIGTLKAMSNLAIVIDNQGKYEEAEQIYRQALQLTEKVLGKEHPSTLNSMNNFANMLDRQGKYEEAKQMDRQALQLREKVLGKEHPSTLDSMNNLAIVLDRQGKYEEAEQMHRQALQLKEKVLGKEHPSTLTSKNNLAACLRARR